MNPSTTSTPVAPADRLDFKKVLPIITIVLIDLLGLTIIIPLLPLYAASFHASPFVIGVLGATYPLMQLIAAPILGRLSDRYGRKPILVFSQIGTLIGFLLLGGATTLWLLFVSRIIDGISGGNISTAQAMIADSTSEQTRTQGLGLIGAAFGLGFILGPIIAFAALALSGNNYHVPAWIAAGMSVVSVVLSQWWLHETHHPALQDAAPSQKTIRTPRKLFATFAVPQVGFLLIVMFVQQFAFGGLEQFLPLFTLSRLGLSGSGNAGVFVFVGVIVVGVQGWLIGRWSRRWGEQRLIVMGLVMLALGLLLIASTPAQPVPWYNSASLRQQLHMTTPSAAVSQPAGAEVSLPTDGHTGWLGLGWLLISLIPISIGGGLVSPSINSMLTSIVTTQERGEVLGTSAAFVSGANVLAPLVGGAIFQVVGIAAPFWFWMISLLITLVLAWRKFGGSERVGIPHQSNP